MSTSSPRREPYINTDPGDAAPGELIDDVRQQDDGERLRQGQFFLAALGYAVAGDRDPAAATDGVFGHHTRGAVLQFQADRGLEASGDLDAPTWEALSAAYEEGCDAESSAPTTDEGDAAMAADEQMSGGIHESTSDVLVELAAPELSEQEMDMLKTGGGEADI